jgi:hypothetical protein
MWWWVTAVVLRLRGRRVVVVVRVCESRLPSRACEGDGGGDLGFARVVVGCGHRLGFARVVVAVVLRLRGRRVVVVVVVVVVGPPCPVCEEVVAAVGAVLTVAPSGGGGSWPSAVCRLRGCWWWSLSCLMLVMNAITNKAKISKIFIYIPSLNQ